MKVEIAGRTIVFKTAAEFKARIQEQLSSVDQEMVQAEKNFKSLKKQKKELAKALKDEDEGSESKVERETVGLRS